MASRHYGATFGTRENPPSRPRVRSLAPALLLAILLLAHAQTWAQSERPVVYVAEISGVINPLSADYLDRALEIANRERAAALLVRIDTPGGLDTAMRAMVQAILESPVPVVIYVGPAGARAASAGLFVTLAAHIAAMAPGTNIGAAHPVGLGGESDAVTTEKVTNDAAAYIRALAGMRGRNAAWSELAVRESVSITAQEAADLGVIDLVAGNHDELLNAIHGRMVRTSAGEITLRTAGADMIGVPMNLAERVLHGLADPNLALLLLSIGTIGLIAELYHPGTWIPGIIGVIALIFAFAALGNLPTNWAGAALVILAAVLLVAEVQTPGIGIFAAGSALAFVLGALFLFRPLGVVSPAAPAVAVSPFVAGALGLGVATFAFVILRSLARSRWAPVAFGPEALVRSVGVASTVLDPTGVVRVQGEDWSAVAQGGPIAAGEIVEVIRVEGVTVVVRPGGEAAPPPVPEARSIADRRY